MRPARVFMSGSDDGKPEITTGKAGPLIAKAKVPPPAGVRTRVLLFGSVSRDLRDVERAMRSGEAEVVTMHAMGNALQALEREEFAATIVDGTTAEVENALRHFEALATERDRDIPVIVLLAADHEDSAATFTYHGGPLDYLGKPLDSSLVRAKLALFGAFFRSRERLRTRLDASVHARDDRVAVVSHDIRNPLSTVLMGARLIEHVAPEGPKGATTRKAVATIVRAVDRIERLAIDLLDMSKIEAGHALSVHCVDHDLTALLHDAVDSVQSLASARRLTVSTDVSAPILVSCDGDRVLQVVGNLLGNAIKFTSEGGSVRVRATDGGPEGEVVVSVADTGIGIASEQVAFVFDPYWQVSSGRKGGAGLGLAIARAIVISHGGRIWAESTPDVGSTFFFTLPSANRASANRPPGA